MPEARLRLFFGAHRQHMSTGDFVQRMKRGWPAFQKAQARANSKQMPAWDGLVAGRMVTDVEGRPRSTPPWQDLTDAFVEPSSRRERERKERCSMWQSWSNERAAQDKGRKNARPRRMQ